MTAGNGDTGGSGGSLGPGEIRARGLAKMEEVYGFSVDPDRVPGSFAGVTIDRLFGELWSDETLSKRERRLMTIGVLATVGRSELLELQFTAALANGEITEDQARATVVHLAHYVGWPLATVVNEAVETVLARRGGGQGGRPGGDASTEGPGGRSSSSPGESR